MTKNNFILLILITIFAFFIRVYQLDLNRPNLYSDEVDLHYKTQAWVKEPNRPLFGYFFYGTYTYSWFLGMNPLAVRLPSAIYMTAAVFLMFFFARAVAVQLNFSSKTLPLLAAGLTAVLPWSFLTSRIGFSHISMLTIIMLGYFILYTKAQNFRGYIVSLLPLLLGVYYYQPIIVAAPFALLLTVYELKSQRKDLFKFILAGAIFLTLTAVIFLYRSNYSNVSVGARGLDLAIWRDVNVTAENNYYRGLSRLSGSSGSLGDKLNYNYPLSVIGTFWKNYLSFFSPEFLFLKGSPVLRHSTGQTGNFFLGLAPFMIYGAYLFFRKGNGRISRFFLVWILATPIASSLTHDGFAASNRVTIMMPFLTYFAGLGVIGVMREIRVSWGKILTGSILAFLILFSTYNFLYGYFKVYPTLAAKDFEFGFKELSDFQVKTGSQKMLVIWDGYYPHYHFRFWQNMPYQSDKDFLPKELKVNESVFNQLRGNLYFSLPKTIEDVKEFTKEREIRYLALPDSLMQKRYGEIMASFSQAEKVIYPDNATAFYILKVQ